MGLRKKCYSVLMAMGFLITIMLVAPFLRAQDLVVNLADPIVAITAGFTGTDVLLFGATRDEGDLVVVVRGPQENHVVRRKEQIGGIWVNMDDVTFVDIPSYYASAANRPITEFVSNVDASIHQIGVHHLIFNPHTLQLPVDDITKFSEALVRIKQRENLYSEDAIDLLYLGNGLFRTTVHFPSNVTVGTYGIDVYLFKEGQLVENKTTLLNVRKFGAEAEIYNFAHNHYVAYGILAVIIAIMAGWLADVIFRKR